MPDTPTRLAVLRRRAHDVRYRMVRRRARVAAAIFRRGTLSLVGLGSLAAACYTVNVTAGLIGTGVALILADWRVV